jgi:L-fuconolactonase
MLRPALRPVFDALEKHGLAFDALVRPQHLEALVELVERHPGLRVVLDHAAKPAIREGKGWAGRARWEERLRRLAAAGCRVKLSGLLTEARPGAGFDELAPFVVPLLWGSDWPVLLLVADYQRWWELSLRLLQGLSAQDQARVLGGNALDFYRLEAA